MVDVGLRRRADDGRRNALLPLALARDEHAVAREAQIHGVARRHRVGVGEFRIDRGHHGLRRQIRLALRDGREGRGHRGGEKIEIVEGAEPIRRAHARDVDAHAPTLGRRRVTRSRMSAGWQNQAAEGPVRLAGRWPVG